MSARIQRRNRKFHREGKDAIYGTIRQNAANEKEKSFIIGAWRNKRGKNMVVGSSCFARNSPLVTRTETGGMKAGSKVLVRTEFPTLDAGYEA